MSIPDNYITTRQDEINEDVAGEEEAREKVLAHSRKIGCSCNNPRIEWEFEGVVDGKRTVSVNVYHHDHCPLSLPVV